MDRIISMDSPRESKGSITLQKKLVEQNRRKIESNNAPDLTDFMNDLFFGTVTDKHKKEYNLTGGGGGGGGLMDEEDVDVDFDDSTRSNSSRLTQEWLDEAKRMVASSPTRCDSPTRLVGSPRFASAQQAKLSASMLDRRDPLSRSARRQRSLEGFSGEILSKSINHTRNKSASHYTSTPASPPDQSPAAAVQKWLSNFLKPSDSSSSSAPSSPTSPKTIPSSDPTAPILPPRQSTHRRSRFQTENPAPQSQGIPVSSCRTFRTTPAAVPDSTTPKNLMIETVAHKRTLSPSSCSSPTPLNQPLSPPKNLVESAQRRSISRSTCSIEKVTPKCSNISSNGGSHQEDGSQNLCLNGFLKEQRILIEKISSEAVDSKAKIILPAASNSTSSMVAAICHAWLLENRRRKNKEQGDGYTVVPVMNVTRAKMWKHLQASWLFHHVGLDAISLLFADEVDLEILMMTGKLSVLVVGQDILRTTAEVGSQCTILTDNYCEDAYDLLLQTPMLKKILLAGILLDTQNLDPSSLRSMSRDAEAVQLLSAGSSPNYRNNFYDQLMQDKKDSSFLEAMSHNYGKSLNDKGQETGGKLDQRVPQRKSHSISNQKAVTQNSNRDSNDVAKAKTNKMSTNPAKHNSVPAQATAAPPPVQPSTDPNRGKNKFFLAKWFGFGSK